MPSQQFLIPGDGQNLGTEQNENYVYPGKAFFDQFMTQSINAYDVLRASVESYLPSVQQLQDGSLLFCPHEKNKGG